MSVVPVPVVASSAVVTTIFRLDANSVQIGLATRASAITASTRSTRANPSPTTSSDGAAGTPDLKKPVPARSILHAEWSSYTEGTELEIYWVDQREWRLARVVASWEDLKENELCLMVHFPGRGPTVLDETMNLVDPHTYNRVRLAAAVGTPDYELATVRRLWTHKSNSAGGLGGTPVRPDSRWGVISRSWWQRWCRWTGFDPTAKGGGGGGGGAGNGGGGDVKSVATTTKTTTTTTKPTNVGGGGGGGGGIRPNTLDGAALLAKDSLRLGTVEVEAVPREVFAQLLDWYGGTPLIERFGVTRPLYNLEEVAVTLMSLSFDDNHHSRGGGLPPILPLLQLIAEYSVTPVTEIDFYPPQLTLWRAHERTGQPTLITNCKTVCGHLASLRTLARQNTPANSSSTGKYRIWLRAPAAQGGGPSGGSGSGGGDVLWIPVTSDHQETKPFEQYSPDGSSGTEIIPNNEVMFEYQSIPIPPSKIGGWPRAAVFEYLTATTNNKGDKQH